MFEQYTEAARRAVFFARYEASQSGSPQIETEHLLLGVLRPDAPLAQRLARSPEEIEAIREQVRKQLPAGQRVSTSVDLPVSKACQHALAHAAEEAKKLKDTEVNPAHLLLGIFHEESSPAARILREHGISAALLRDEARHGVEESRVETPAQPPPSAEGFRDLTELARNGALGPLVGRERELERVLHILGRRTKNNPVLIGEAGVGKTAIVEGLARRMADAEVPPMLIDRRLVALDASSLAAPGKRSRSVEQLDSLLAGLKDPAETILFVRGLFNLASAGSAWAVVEAMHALEPHLAHGGLQCIATGSPAGLRETLEKAGMLARHFEVVAVAPVSEAAAIEIVSSLKTQFERFHEVTFGEGAIETAVEASGRFLPQRHLPDRAIDLIDEAAAAVKLRRASEPRDVAEARRRIRQHAQAMENAIANHEFEKARDHSDAERREREGLERLREQYGLDDARNRTVTPEDIVAAVAARAGVPVEAVKRALEQKAEGDFERIAGELAARLPVEAREWLPFLAAYLARCSPEEAEALAQAIQASKPGAE